MENYTLVCKNGKHRKIGKIEYLLRLLWISILVIIVLARQKYLYYVRYKGKCKNTKEGYKPL